MNVLPVIAGMIAMLGPPAGADGLVTFRANPSHVCADERQPYLNFDFILVNHGPGDIQLKELRGFVLDSRGAVVERRFIANAPWLSKIEAGSDRILYNPMFFRSANSGSRVRYELDYEADGLQTKTVEVRPHSCVTKARLVLPVSGRILVYDGSDFLSHHRRSNYLGLEELGITDNFHRYGLDFMPVDGFGRMYSGNRQLNESWFGWNQPIRAPGDGTVIAVHNQQPDNTVVGDENLWTQRSLAKDPMTPYGNYVLIDHGGGEFSLLAHVRQGSVAVSRGQPVRAGDVVARIGNSGSSLGPHLHYELRNGWGVAGIRTQPAYFRDVRVIATGEVAGPRGLAVNTGDILIAR